MQRAKIFVFALFFSIIRKMAAMFGVRRIFLKILAFTYFVAFWSWNSQVIGLIGENGILPLRTYLAQWEPVGVARFWFLPNLFWFSSSDFTLRIVCYLGLVFSVVLFLGLIPRFCLLVLWILYFSCVAAGQVFMGYQWDAFLLETGFLSLFLGHTTFMVPKITIYLFRLLYFRLLFMSGLSKLVSGDPTWANLTALDFHFETQPLPTPLAWWAHNLPSSLLRFTTGTTLMIELLIPFFFLLPRAFRIVGFWFSTLLQINIIATGNYTYFNILTLGIGLFLVDDKHLSLFVPGFLLKRPLPTIPWKIPVGIEAQFLWIQFRKLIIPIGSALLGVGGLLMILNLVHIILLPDPIQSFLVRNLQRYHIVNSYGLFAVMTTQRSELSIEGSQDGTQWVAYKFKYKPEDLDQKPPIIAPFQPRLDWQMWFAALSGWRHNLWLQHLVYRLLQGEPTVTDLLQINPFPNQPPRWIRIRKYRYEFTDKKERNKTGNWWKRGPPADYTPPLSL